MPRVNMHKLLAMIARQSGVHSFNVVSWKIDTNFELISGKDVRKKYKPEFNLLIEECSSAPDTPCRLFMWAQDRGLRFSEIIVDRWREITEGEGCKRQWSMEGIFDKVSYAGAPPDHKNCRCTNVPIQGGEERCNDGKST